MNLNPLNYIDAYKYGHREQYPPNTRRVFSNYTPRASRLPGVSSMVFFSLQYFVQEYLIRQFHVNFFQKRRDIVLKEYKRRRDGMLGEGDWPHYIGELHELGYLPLCIKALPEGSLVPIKVPALIMYNTDERFGWLTNYFETILSTTIWMGCNSATIAREYRKLLQEMAIKTGGDMNMVPFQAHDFSMRGMPGLEAACISSAGHLLFSNGTDSVPSLDFIEKYYPVRDNYFIGGSVPATEHSVMSAWGSGNEFGLFKKLITEIYPGGIVSVVSDTWDLWKVLTEYLPTLKDTILSRDGKLVIRPDSGDPADILCGTSYPLDSAHGHPLMSARRKGVIECLWDTFGGKEINGYKHLHPSVGAIYGDSITLDRAKDILERLEAKGFASTNIVFGVGSFTYQYNTRDTLGQAMKATWADVGGEGRELFKDPVTDTGMKKSAKGLLAVNPNENGVYTLEEQVEWDDVLDCSFEQVFMNGHHKPVSFEKIRETALATI